MLIDEQHSYFEIKNGIHGVGVFTTRNFKIGEVLFEMKGEILSKPTRTSVQIGDNKHIEDIISGRINHSCDPNVAVDRITHSFVCIKDISAGEEISFDYNSNEDMMASPFVCACCGREIFGKMLVEKKEVRSK